MYFNILEHSRVIDAKPTLMDLLAIPGPLAAVLTPWLILFTTMIYPIDPFYFILDSWFENHYERTILDILYISIFRCFTLLAGFELARCLGHAGVLSIIAVSIATRASQLVKKGNMSSFRILIIYRYLVLCYTPVMSLVILGSSIVTSAFFWGLVAGWWIVFNRYEQVPGFLYFIIASFCFIFTIGYKISLFLAAKIGEDICSVISKVRLRTKIDYMRQYKLKRWRKILWLTAKGTRPMKVPYTQYICIDQEFCLGTMWNLCNRVIDAILIIK